MRDAMAIPHELSAHLQTLEQTLQAKFRDKPALSITGLDKLRDGWESDNYRLTVDYGGVPPTRANWVWRIYSGVGSQAKAVRECTSMKKLLAVGYPVPQVFLLAAEHSPVGRPFIIMEYIQGEVMWDLLGAAPADRQARLLDQFCRLFVQLHQLDWQPFDASLPGDAPFFFIDRWLNEASGMLRNFPEVDGASFAAMRADMAAHRRVYRLFIERTGLPIAAFDNLFGRPSDEKTV